MEYLGRQESLEEGTNYLELYTCLTCRTTIVLDEDLQDVIIIEDKNKEEKG